MEDYDIRLLHSLNLLQDIDLHFAGLMMTLAGAAACPELALAAGLVSNTTAGKKHICLDLEASASRPLTAIFGEVPENTVALFEGIQTPAARTWSAKLSACPVVGAPGEYRPLVLDEQNRLYLYRYWAYEQQLAAEIKTRIRADRRRVDPDTLQAGLARYFPPSRVHPDWQKIAAFAAVTGHLAIISGGPGTGKTHTVTNILALLLELHADLRATVCAPTGKAAARIQESIKKTKQTLDCPPQLRSKIPDEATTIHRLLGVRRNSPNFYHDQHNPLPIDVLIVDEASMVSLALMTKLLRATAAECRVILLGDRNQLASVEAGAVLGDLCTAADPDSYSEAFCELYDRVGAENLVSGCAADQAALSDCAVELKYSYRFEASSAIGAVSRAVNSGDAKAALAVTDQDTSGTISREALPDPGELEDRLAALVETGHAGPSTAEDLQGAFRVLDTFRILCSHRRGPYGVAGINRLMESVLQKKGLIDASGPYYRGRPIMLQRNDYTLGLYNGDVGVIWPDATGENRAWFPDRTGGFRALSTTRLPAHETVYAMTIHKSQGSEFDRILMILPNVASPIFTRELVYTGLTRARQSVAIWAEAATFETAVQARVERRSGLRDALRRPWRRARTKG